MFTGIVASVGRVTESTPSQAGARLRIDAGRLSLEDVVIGDSIAVNGTCLTVVALDGRHFEVDVSHETMRCTAGFVTGARVNLEKALRLADRLGGHFVTGHIDGTGRVCRAQPVGENRLVQIEVPEELSKYIARKGSVTVNGVSLTVNEVLGRAFSVNLIPHTLAMTNLAELQPDAVVNIEIDLLARYAERLLDGLSRRGS